MWIKFEPPVKKTYTTLRMWTQTRDKFKDLAKHFDMTIIDFLEALALQLTEQFIDQDDGEKNDQETVKGRADKEDDGKA